MKARQILVMAGIFLGLLLPGTVHSATYLTVSPVTWDVIGLDSNNVNVGPNDFPVGARVCNLGGSSTSVTNISFVWDDGAGVYTSSPGANAYINLRDGTLSSLYSAGSPLTLAAGACSDAYFEVIVNRVSTAYDKSRRYNITATDAGGTAKTPIPRQIYIEHLISQSRNVTNMVSYSTDGFSYTTVAAGGTMTLLVGETYWIKLDASTATQGYNQLESFVNFPNTIFQVLSVESTYSADSSLPPTGYVPNPNDKLYADACLWDPDPNSPNYRSCTGIDGKAGGTITVVYKVKILTVPGAPLVNPAPLSTLIHDFSGSSYHYNADFSAQARYAQVVSPVTITKAFSPNTVSKDTDSTMTFTLTNISSSTASSINFTDTTGWPAGMRVGSSATVTSNGNCGSYAYTPSPLVIHSTSSISFSSISIAAGATCTLSIQVESATDGTYANTTGNLFIGAIDTGSKASATLVVSSAPGLSGYTCTAGEKTTLVAWNFDAADGGSATNPNYTSSTKASDVNAGTTIAAANGGTTITLPATAGSTSGANVWRIEGGWETIIATPTHDTTPNFQFQVDTSNYGDVEIRISHYLDGAGDWGNPADNTVFVHTSADGGTNWTDMATGINSKKAQWNAYNASPYGVDVVAAATGSSTTMFRINGKGVSTGKTAGAMLLDDVTFVGCRRPNPPTLSKAFSPTTVEADTTDATTTPSVRYSTLTFTIDNPNTLLSAALTGVAFSDTLPDGLVVANPPTVSAVSCTTGTLTGQTITAAAGSNTISMTGGSLSGTGTARATGCTFSVRVQGQVAGSYTNNSNSISANYSGPNTGGANVGYGSATLNVVDPPSITKKFASNLIYTTAPNTTTTLSFTINNTAAAVMTSVAVSDTLPAGLTVPTATTSVCGGANNLVTTSPTSIVLTGGSIASGGSCTFNVTVTGAVAGNYTNTTGTVSGTVSGVSLTGKTASDSITVKTRSPKISLVKQSGLSVTGPWAAFTTVPTPLPQNVYFRFMIENTGDTELTTVRINDLSLPGLDVSSCNTASLAVYDTKECVAGLDVVSAAGAYTNTANATSVEATSTNSTARYGTANLLLAKNVTPNSFAALGDVLNYTYNVFNNGSAPLAGPVAVADDKATVTCPDVNTVGNFDGNLDPDEGVSCTATYTVVAGDVTAGLVTNTATATVGGTNSNTVSKTVYMTGVTDLTVTKGNNVNEGMALGSSFTWTLLVSDAGPVDATFASGQTILRDPLPNIGVPYGSPTPGSFTNITNSGNISCSIDGSNVLTCIASGAPVTIGNTNGSFKVTVSATPSAVGTYDSTATVDPNNNVTESNETNNTSADTVKVYRPPALTKSFGAASVANGGSTTLTLTLTNPSTPSNPGALSAVKVDDTFPGGMILESTTFTFTPGGCGTVTRTDGSAAALYDTTVRFSVATLAVDASCAVQMTVSCWTTGTMNNTTGAPTVGDPILTGTAASASLTVTAPTAVKLISFVAIDRGDWTDLRWRTGYEVSNLGFNIYRDDGRGRQRINADLIVGSVLLAGPRVAVTAGRSYSWRDESAGGGASYFLEDVDINGRRTLSGPFVPAAATSAGLTASEQSATLSTLSATPRGRNGEMATRAAGEPTARTAAAVPVLKLAAVDIADRLSPAQVQWKLADSPAVKIAVKETGWYRITQAELAAYGIDKVDQRYLQLYANGRQVPMAVSDLGKKNQFDPQDSIGFYGTGIDEPLTDTQTYWLVLAKNQGLRIQAAAGGKNAEEPSSYACTVESRPRLYYIPALPRNEEGDRFYGPYIYSEAITMSLNVRNASVAAGLTAVLDVTLQGILDGEHIVDVVLNGTRIGQVVFSEMGKGQAALQFSQSLLKEGENQLQLTALGGESDFSFLDVVRLTYQHTYTADDDVLRFTGNGGGTLTLSGFSASDIRVMDITDPDPVSEVYKKVAAQGSSYSATFNVPAQGGRTLFAFAGKGILHPAAMTANTPSSWHERGNRADLVMIAHRSLMSALMPLKQYRESQGRLVALVDVEDAYDEFSFGNKTPLAIQEFLLNARAVWAKKPAFVLLTGSATYDPRYYLDGMPGYNGPLDLVPTNNVAGFYSEAASDDLFADFNDDGLPEMNVGRIPAGIAAEVTAVVSKIVGYEQAAFDTWAQRAVVVSDSDPGAFDFEGDSDEIAAMLAPSMTTGVEKLYRENGAGATAVVDSVNRGALVVNYLGHGSEDLWGGNGFSMFDSDDAAGLTNGTKLPFFMNMNCWNGSFPNLFTLSLGEVLLNNPRGGAVAVWASSGLTEPAPQHDLNKEMIRLLFNGSHLTLGEAAAQAKAATTDLDVRRTWILFGDPMTRLKQ